MRFIASLGLIGALILPASGQTARQYWEACVETQSMEQWLGGKSPAMSAEMGFFACKVEEERIQAILRLTMTPANADMMMVSMKMQVKSRVIGWMKTR